MKAIAVMMLSLAIVGAACVTGCRRSEIQPSRALTQGVGAVLQGTGESYQAGQKIALDFYIANRTSKSVRIDGRLSWPGTIDLWAKMPDGKVTRASRICVKMSQPMKTDMITLDPGRLYGMELVLDESDESLDTGLKHMKPGQYTLWATYYNHGNPEERSNQLSLTSNKVQIMVN